MEIAIYPSHIETGVSFAAFSDGNCDLFNWLALYLTRILKVVDRRKWVGHCFFANIWGRCMNR